MRKIAILENYSLFCSGIAPVLASTGELEVVAESKHLREFLDKLKTVNPDVIIIDIIHCEMDDVSIIKKVMAKASKTPVLLVVSKDYSHQFENYIALGVNGIVCTSSNREDLIDAVKSLHDGMDYFPPRIWILLKEYLSLNYS